MNIKKIITIILVIILFYLLFINNVEGMESGVVKKRDNDDGKCSTINRIYLLYLNYFICCKYD